jgi:putative sterol carrier protein
VPLPSIHEFFRSLPEHFDAEIAEGLTAVYQFDLTGPHGAHYTLLIQDGACLIEDGSHAQPDLTLTLSAEDCVRILNGQQEGHTLALSGRVQITGDIGLALQLKALFPSLNP